MYGQQLYQHDSRGGCTESGERVLEQALELHSWLEAASLVCFPH